MEPTPITPLLLDVPTAARTLSVSRRQIYKLFDRGDLTKLKIGKSSRVSAENLRRYVDGLASGGAA